MSSEQGRIGFIGAGNMGEALVRSLVQAGWAPQRLLLADPKAERLAELADRLGVTTMTDNAALVEQCDTVVLAVKPQMLDAVLAPLSPAWGGRLLISLLAGVDTARLEALLPDDARVVRTMPNTPALVGEGATAICAGRNATAADLERTRQLFAAAGVVCEVPEAQMDAVTGLSGSGPAYVFAVIEALADGGVAEGLPRDTALKLAAQTVLGAARLVRDGGEHPAVLKDRVCSPGGTTIAGMKALEESGLRAALQRAVSAATRRSRELGGRS